MRTVVLKKDDDVDQERFVERLARFVGEGVVVLRACLRLDNRIGIATASMAACQGRSMLTQSDGRGTPHGGVTAAAGR